MKTKRLIRRAISRQAIPVDTKALQQSLKRGIPSYRYTLTAHPLLG